MGDAGWIVVLAGSVAALGALAALLLGPLAAALDFRGSDVCWRVARPGWWWPAAAAVLAVGAGAVSRIVPRWAAAALVAVALATVLVSGLGYAVEGCRARVECRWWWLTVAAFAPPADEDPEIVVRDGCHAPRGLVHVVRAGGREVTFPATPLAPLGPLLDAQRWPRCP